MVAFSTSVALQASESESQIALVWLTCDWPKYYPSWPHCAPQSQATRRLLQHLEASRNHCCLPSQVAGPAVHFTIVRQSIHDAQVYAICALLTVVIRKLHGTQPQSSATLVDRINSTVYITLRSMFWIHTRFVVIQPPPYRYHSAMSLDQSLFTLRVIPNTEDPNILDLVDPSGVVHYRKQRLPGSLYEIHVYGTCGGSRSWLIAFKDWQHDVQIQFQNLYW